MRKVVLGLLAWTVLSVPLGILVGKVLKAQRGGQGPPEPPVWVNKASPESPEVPGLLAFRVPPENPENGASPERKDRPVPPVP